MDRPPSLHAVLVTHRRPQALATHLDVLVGQDRRPDRLVVVDNAASPETAAAVGAARARGLAVEHVAAPENLGPAGGIALGLGRALDGAHGDDWVVLLDDDDPPASSDALAQQVAFATEVRATRPRLGGVGLTGARFDRRAGRVVRVPDHLLVGVVTVDYLGGNQLPCYLVEAVRDTGTFDGRLFFGFEELDFGLRMRRRGWELAVDGDAWFERRVARGRTGAGVGAPSLRARREPWRAYYTNRNLIHLLREDGSQVAALRVAAGRVVGKAIVNRALGRPQAAEHLHLAVAAARDGWRGRLGRTVEPRAKAGVS